jgi:L-lactate dehydrogenase complex protein LldG
MTVIDTRAARAAIFASLRVGECAAAAAVPPPDLSPYLGGPFGHGTSGPRVDPATLIAPFEAAARGWRADVLQADLGNWPQAVCEVLRRHRCARVVIGAASPLQSELGRALDGLEVRKFDRPIEHWKTELFGDIDASVTAAEAGIADTGTLVLCPGPREPRALSLVPGVHVAVLHTSRLFASLPAAVQSLQPQRNLPSNWLLVTGPSKTADIQQTLAFGAHGPKVLVIVMVDDLPMMVGD